MTATEQKLIDLYRQMSDLTRPECSSPNNSAELTWPGCSCKIPFSCCSPEYCQDTIGYAKEHWGVTLEPLETPGTSTRGEPLPLLGPEGCIADPHLRPICTVHTCEVMSFGFKVDDPEGAWTKRYFELRFEIDTLEFERVEEKGPRKGEDAPSWDFSLDEVPPEGQAD